MKKIISFLIRKVPRRYLQVLSPPVMKFLAWWFRGNKYTCPIDGRSYRKLLPYGRIEARANALAPGSLSLERHRLIWLYLQRKTNFFNTKMHFLHIAPEQCFMKKFEEMHGEGYITADIESPLAKVKMDIHHIPFPDNHFDALMCNHVLEHVESDFQALKELHRVLKPGGWAVLQVPFFFPLTETTLEDKTIVDPLEREKQYGQSDRVRRYGKDYADRIRSVGFKVTEDDFVKSLEESEIRKFALPAEEIIFIAVK